MEINRICNGKELSLKVSGRLDTLTSPALEAELHNLEDFNSLVFDFENLDYISSAGLRVVLMAQKTMNQKGSMVIKNVKPEINEVFEITGFSKILKIV